MKISLVTGIRFNARLTVDLDRTIDFMDEEAEFTPGPMPVRGVRTSPYLQMPI